LSGRMPAAGVISLLSLLSLLVPPLAFFFSGVPVGLVTLRKGAWQATQVIVICLGVMFLFTLVMKIQPLLALVVLGTIWLPVCLCSLVLRMTERPAWMALTAGAIAAAFVLFMYVRTGDVEAWWRSLLSEALESGLPAGTAAQYQQAIELAPLFMNAVVTASIVMTLVLTVLISRWWQSALFNPGGFAREFHAFRLPRQLALPAILCLGLLFLDVQPYTAMLRDMLVICLVLYLFQGIASVHRTVKIRGMSVNWLFAMYLLLAFLPQLMVIFIAWMGLTDSLLRVRGQPPQDRGE